MPRSVHIVCANALERDGLSALISSEGLTVGQTAASVGELALDPSARGMAIIAGLTSGSEGAVVRELVAAFPHIRPIVLSTTFDFAAMVACFREGSNGYLVKDISVHALIGALDMIASGQKVMPSNLADELTRHSERAAPQLDRRDPVELDEMKRLSSRERDVLCCLMSGYSNKAIARQLNVSEATIKVNVKAILRKLNVSNRTQAAIWARQQGASGLPGNGRLVANGAP